MIVFLMDNRAIVSVVQSLIETVEEDLEGYRLAAEASTRSDVRLLFIHYAKQREEFSIELHRLEQAYGGGLPATPHRGGFTHGWSDLPGALKAGDSQAILTECERGEGYAIGAYRKALSQELPLDVQMIIGAQSLEVKAAHDKVRYLCCGHN